MLGRPFPRRIGQGPRRRLLPDRAADPARDADQDQAQRRHARAHDADGDLDRGPEADGEVVPGQVDGALHLHEEDEADDADDGDAVHVAH